MMRRPATALLLVLATLLWPVIATAGGGGGGGKEKLCRISNAVSNGNQISSRLDRCKKNDIVQVPVVVQSLPLSEVAGRVCDFDGQVLLEPTTEDFGIGRITCSYPGDVRKVR